MDFDVELLEITKDNLEEAQFMASTFIDEEVKNRVFLNVIGAECLVNHLEKFEIDISNLHNIHSIKRVVEKIDISDIILNNIHIDVRVVLDKNLIFIPKSHFEYRVAPDIYVVLKCDSNMTRATLYGFFEASEINVKNHNDDYYFFEPYKLHSPFELTDYILNFKDKKDKQLTSDQMLRGKELSVAVSDHDVTKEEFKEFLGLLMVSNELRSSVLEFDNFETLASRVAFALQIKKPKVTDDTSVVGVADFINLEQADDGTDNNESDSADQEDSGNENGAADVAASQVPEDVVSEDAQESAAENSEEDEEKSVSEAESPINDAMSTVVDNTISGTAAAAAAAIAGSVLPAAGITGDADSTISEGKEENQEDPDLTNSENKQDSADDLSSFESEDIDLDFDDNDLDFSDFESDIAQQATEDFIEDDDEVPSEDNTPSDADYDISEENNENDEISQDSADTVSHFNIDDEVENSDEVEAEDSKFDFTDYRNQNSTTAESSEDKDWIKEEEDVHDISEFSSAEISESSEEQNEEEPTDLYELSEVTSGFNTMSDAVNLTSDANDIKETIDSDFVPITSENDIDIDENDNIEYEITEDPNFETDHDAESAQDSKDVVTENEITDGDEVIQEEDVIPNEEPKFEEQDTNFEMSDVNFGDEEQDLTEDNKENEDNDLADENFGMVDDFDNFDAMVSGEQNAEVAFSDNSSPDLSEISNKNITNENSVVITDKDLKPGEIIIDINVADTSSQMYSGNEHLEELYSNSSFNRDSGLNNDTRIVSSQTNSVPLAAGLGGIVVIFLIVSVVLFSIYKFMNPSPQESPKPVVADKADKEVKNNLGTDVPDVAKIDNQDIVMNDSPAPVRRNTNIQTDAPEAKTAVKNNTGYKHAASFISVKKLSWEVPDYISYDSKFQQYFQSSGKSLKSSLTSDLLLANDYTYSDSVKVSILFDRSGNFQNAKILSSSGSNQIDDIVLQSVNQTLKVLKAPNSLGNDQSTTVILKIYL